MKARERGEAFSGERAAFCKKRAALRRQGGAKRGIAKLRCEAYEAYYFSVARKER